MTHSHVPAAGNIITRVPPLKQTQYQWAVFLQIRGQAVHHPSEMVPSSQTMRALFADILQPGCALPLLCCCCGIDPLHTPEFLQPPTCA